MKLWKGDGCDLGESHPTTLHPAQVGTWICSEDQVVPGILHAKYMSQPLGDISMTSSRWFYRCAFSTVLYFHFHSDKIFSICFPDLFSHAWILCCNTLLSSKYFGIFQISLLLSWVLWDWKIYLHNFNPAKLLRFYLCSWIWSIMMNVPYNAWQ